jgi:hypothetical protein
MSRVWFALGVLGLASIGAAQVWWSAGPAELLVVTGGVLALMAPGTGLLLAAWPRRLGAVERATLTVPLSVLLAALVGVGLDHSPLGLAPRPFALGLWAVSMGLVAIGWARWRPSVRPAHARRAAVGGGSPRRVAEVAMAGVVLGVLGLWVVAGLRDASVDPPRPFTGLALNGTAAGSASAVEIDNQEGSPMRYDLDIRVGEEPASYFTNLEVPAGGRLQVPLPAASTGAVPLEVVLYRADDPTPYRSVRLPARPPEAAA